MSFFNLKFPGTTVKYVAKQRPPMSMPKGKMPTRITFNNIQKPKFRQYGDKGYKPSDGTGVGY